jgi:DNA-binding IclR family transcriptional regulator
MERCTINMRVVKSQLSHCLALFEAMSDASHDHRLTDLAAELDMPKSSMQRLLEHLAQEGWVEQDHITDLYRLTLRIAVLGQRYMQSAGITDATQGILERVARETSELVRLTAVDHDKLVWIGSAQGAPAGLLYQPSMSGRVVSFATANGKAWLATLSDEDACSIALRDGLGGKTANVGPKAIGTIDALLAQLHAAPAVLRSPMKRPNRELPPSLSPSAIP